MKDLTERLERATGPDRELDALIEQAAYPGGSVFIGDLLRYRRPYQARGFPRVPFYTSSIDAALTLVPEDAEWSCVVGHQVGEPVARIWHADQDEADMGAANTGATPAIALCIAALKARTP